MSDRIAELEAQLTVALAERDDLQARVNRTLSALVFHQLREGETLDVRIENGNWMDVAGLLGTEIAHLQWGTVYELSTTEEDRTVYDSEEAARAAVAESPSDTGLIVRSVTADNVPLSDWIQAN